MSSFMKIIFSCSPSNTLKAILCHNVHLKTTCSSCCCSCTAVPLKLYCTVTSFLWWLKLIPYSCCFCGASSPLTATNFKIALVETVHCLVQNLHLISDILGVLIFYGERDNRNGESLDKHGDMINVNVFLSSYCHSSEGEQTAWRLCVGWHDARCLCPALGIPCVVLALLTRPCTSWRNLGPLYC